MKAENLIVHAYFFIHILVLQIFWNYNQLWCQVVLFMEELGFEEEGIGRILRRCPEIFAASVEKTLKKKLHQLVEFGISEDRLPRVIRKYPELLISDVNSTLLPR